MTPAGRCVVCRESAMRGFLCAGCARSYDRWNATATGDMIAIIEWAAGRARRAEAKRARKAAARLRGAP